MAPSGIVHVVDRTIEFIRAGRRAVTVDAPIAIGPVAVRIAGGIARKGRPLLLIVGNGQVRHQAVVNLEREFPHLKVAGTDENCDIAVVTWAEAVRWPAFALASTYTDFVFDDRFPEHAAGADALARAILKASGRQVVDVRGPEPRLDLGEVRIRLHTDGQVEIRDTAAPAAPSDPFESIEAALQAVDSGRKDCVILVDREVVPATLAEMTMWGLRTGGISVSVGFDELPNGGMVSTIFVGGLAGRRPSASRHFETLVSDGNGGEVVEKYETWTEAEAGHARLLAEHSSPAP